MTQAPPKFEAGATLGPYEIQRKETLEHLHGTYYELTHTKTGARHIHIAVADDNNTFGVLFPTVPKDSTGVAHILEHVVLAGSQRFPVRDPFFSMLPRSLKTFMNAMTSNDSTIYPISTRNTKDFFNLLEVYLDATLFPLLNETSFQQEGHRLEFEQTDDPDSGLRFKGVVFNEMKGAMASPPSVMHRAIGKALFPDLTYAQNSGGDPAKIPDLTWKALKEFHARHYHPSNAYFYTYGNIPLDQILEAIEKHALSRFERIDVDVAIPDQKRFDAPRELQETYALAKEEDARKKSQALVCWLTTNVADSFEVFALKVLREVLLDNAASPLHKALIDSGLGDALADGTGFQTSYREAPFCVGLKGINAEDAKKVEKIVLDTLEAQVRDGVDPQKVDAAVHQLEIESREISNAAFPYSLKVFFQLSGAYVYGGDPYRLLQFDEDLARLEKEREAGPFFENLIRRRFLDNPHRCLIALTPDQEKEERDRETELARLAGIEKKLAAKKKQEIVRRAQHLKELQEAKQDLSSLPTLELSDVPMEFEDVPHTIEKIAGARVGFFPQPTNGLTYIDVRADFSGLPDRLKDSLSLFAYAVPKSGAGADDYLKMAERIDAYTGGISAGAAIRSTAGEDGGFRQSLTLSGKALARNHEPFVGILEDLLSSVSFEPKRLKDLIAEQKVRLEGFVVQAGMIFARLVAASKLTASSALEERLSGLTQLGLLKDLSKLSEGELEAVIADLDAIRDHLFRAPGLQICVTSEEKHFPELRRLLEGALAALASTPAKPAASPAPALGLRHEAKTTSVPVAYNAKVFRTVGFTHPDAPALLVLSNFMRATYLHRELRERGGAYGGRATFDREGGLFDFWTYRDPNIVRSFQVFESAVQEVTKGTLEQDDLKEAILSSCGDVDPLLSPDTKGRTRFFDDLAGFTLDLKAKFKQGLLEVTEDDLRRVADAYLAGEGASLAVISNPDKVREANEQMGEVFEVSAI